MVSLS
ncbi:unnamed protein product [Gulo gulo]